MIILFWGFTLILSLIAIGILMPWLKIKPKSLLLSFLIIVFSYSFYFAFGKSQGLQDYYSPQGEKDRTQMQRMRPLIIELKKQEFRLRFHLEENPKDYLAQSQLLELLSIEALQTGDQDLAKQFLIKSLELLSDTPENFQRRKHIQELLKSNF